MKQTDLDILLREGEGSMLEYKEAFSSSLARDLAALANSSGGKILLGVRDDGKVFGIRDSNQLRAQVQDIARNRDPTIKILVEALGRVMVITVRESESVLNQGLRLMDSLLPLSGQMSKWLEKSPNNLVSLSAPSWH
jgi:ATP-dependent DNA helicase RecG